MLTEMRKARLLTPRPVAASVDELLAGATERHPFAHSDSKSGVGFERVTIDGKSHVLKHVHIDNDWTMRFFHETTCIPLEVWRVGLMGHGSSRDNVETLTAALGSLLSPQLNSGRRAYQ